LSFPPTLLIVAARDEVPARFNCQAQADLRCENHLAVVPGAIHLFEEPGTLQAAGGLARDWFISHLAHSPHLVTQTRRPQTLHQHPCSTRWRDQRVWDWAGWQVALPAVLTPGGAERSQPCRATVSRCLADVSGACFEPESVRPR